MTTAATHQEQRTTTEATLCVAFALSEKTWKLGFTMGHGQQLRERTAVSARHQERVLEEISQAKRRVGLSTRRLWSVAIKRVVKASGCIGFCRGTGQIWPTPPGSSALLVNQRWPLLPMAKRYGC
jgi:hypothetical protein